MEQRSTSAFVREIPANADESRTIPFVISNGTRDRHRTVLNPDNWDIKNYLRNPIVSYNHNIMGGGLFSKPSPDDSIGFSEISFESKNMIGSVKFEDEKTNPQAEKIFRKVKFGTLRAASVTFAPLGKGKYGIGEEARGAANETFYFDGQELIEWGIVDIPSNATAVKRDNYQAPTLEDVLNKYTELEKEFNIEELRKLDIVTFLKSIEGIAPLTLTKRNVDKKILERAEKALRLHHQHTYNL